MRIIKLSENFTPICEEVLFGIETENNTPSDLSVEIVNSTSGDVVATQLLRGVTSAKINISPYLVFAIEQAPSLATHTSITEAPTAIFHICVNGVASECVTVSVNRTFVAPRATISPMPPVRRICCGERDELLLHCKANDLIRADITGDNGEVLSVEYVTSSGMAILFISTEDFGTDVRTLSVELLCNGESIGNLSYILTPKSFRSTRLVWLSEQGSVERYSFPITQKSHRNIEKQQFLSANGLLTASSTTREVLTLASRYEPRATIEALAQIASATKVWIEDGCDLQEVEVCNSEIEYNLFNRPDIIVLEICRWQKEVSLW